MPEALALVKRELGPDALILGTRTLPAGGLAGLAGREQVEITATGPSHPNPGRESGAVVGGAPRMGVPATCVAGSDSERANPNPGRKSGAVVGGAPRTGVPATCVAGSDSERANPNPGRESGDDGSVVPPPDLSPLFYPYYVQLVQNEVAADLARQLVEQAAARAPTAGDARWALQAVIREFIASHTLPAPDSLAPQQTSRRVALVGPPGSGKTTTLVKLAAEYQLRRKQPVALLSLDVHSVGRSAQLRHYANLLGFPLHVAQTVDEVRKALSNSENVEVILIDTPGIGFRDQGRFARTISLLHAARPDETHVVVPASLTPDVQQRTLRAFAQFDPHSVILTRLDEVVGAGVILNMMRHLNMLLSYVTTGQNVPLDLENACESRLTELVLPPNG